MVGKYLLLAGIALILISGCLTTRTVDDCNNDNSLQTDWQKASCYHEAAIGYAIQLENDSAVDACMTIRGMQGTFTGSEANNCFMDIAEIVHRKDICDNIEPSVSEGLGSIGSMWTSFKDECKDKAEPVNYEVKLCPPAFMLFSALGLAFVFARRK